MQPRGPALATALARAESVPGWLSEPQARWLFEHAADLPPQGLAVEIGSHLGRSTVVLASALPARAGLVCIDPFLPDWRYGRKDTEQQLRANLEAPGLLDRVEIHARTSREVRSRWRRPVDLVYVDGAHDPWHAWDDLRWARWVRPGGTVLVHDAFSSVGVTLALMAHVAGPSRLRYAGRRGSLARFVVVDRPWRPVGPRLAMLAELPWFARNVLLKMLLRLRLRGVASRLGHDAPEDPY